MPLITPVFKGLEVSLISKVNKEMQIRCIRKVHCWFSSRCPGNGKKQLWMLGNVKEGRVQGALFWRNQWLRPAPLKQRLCLQGYSIANNCCQKENNPPLQQP